MTPTCEEAVVKELVALRRKAMDYLQRDGQVAADAYFCAEQNALVVRNAEEYYRNMFRREVSSWNLRDTHMMESLVSLNESSQQTGDAGENHRLGTQLPSRRRARDADGRARRTESRSARARTFWQRSVSIGFTTYDGTVTAASDWDAPAERKNVRPAHPDSYEALFHEVDVPNFLLNLRDNRRSGITSPRRATGTRYRRDLSTRH